MLTCACVVCSTQRVTEEKLEVGSRRLESLEQQLAEREKEMEDANLQRTILQKDVQMLKQNLKGRTGHHDCMCFSARLLMVCAWGTVSASVFVAVCVLSAWVCESEFVVCAGL